MYNFFTTNYSKITKIKGKSVRNSQIFEKFLVFSRRFRAKLTELDRFRILEVSRELKPKWKQVAAEVKRRYRLEVSPQTCDRTWRRWKNSRSVKDLSRSGRPKLCSAEKERAMCKFARSHRFADLNAISDFCSTNLGVDMSAQTVSRILQKKGLFRRIAETKPLLSATAKQKRLIWAENHSKFSMRKWKKIIFSDEKIFKTGNCRRSLFVTRKVGEKFSPHCIQSSVRNAPQIHVWGAIGWNGPGPLKLVDGNLTAIKYQTQIINDLHVVGPNLVPGNGHFTFQQDMAPAHNARSTHAFLHDRGIPELEWPGNSPDLNIIENLWASVARKIRAYNTLPRSTQELWERVQNAWQSIPVPEIHKLYMSIPSRIQETIAAHGGSTHY